VQEASAPSAAPESGAPAPTVSPADQRKAERDEERNRRYGELRKHAAEVGIELPETPPWEQAQMARPSMTPAERDAMRAAHYQAMRERAKAQGIDLPETPPVQFMTEEERRAHWEKMRNMTPEERMAARGETYKQLRERAAAQGIELPETPPWEQAQQRRKAMQEKWESYRKEFEGMTDAQREAARAMLGGAPAPEGAQMPGPMPMDMPAEMPMGGPMGRPMDMPMGGPMGRPMGSPMGRPMDMPQGGPMGRPMDMPRGGPMGRPMDMPQGGPMGRPMDMPMGGPMGRPMDMPQGGPMGRPMDMPMHGGMMPPHGVMPGWGGAQGPEQAFPQSQSGFGAPWGRGY
jgi:hypothetical protein